MLATRKLRQSGDAAARRRLRWPARRAPSTMEVVKGQDQHDQRCSAIAAAAPVAKLTTLLRDRRDRGVGRPVEPG